MRKIEFGCCFCGEGGADRGLVVTEMGTGEAEQQWFCHLSCLIERMTDEAARAQRQSYE